MLRVCCTTLAVTVRQEDAGRGRRRPGTSCCNVGGGKADRPFPADRKETGDGHTVPSPTGADLTWCSAPPSGPGQSSPPLVAPPAPHLMHAASAVLRSLGCLPIRLCSSGGPASVHAYISRHVQLQSINQYNLGEYYLSSKL